jgi:opacity protein-like surface antigen
MSALGAALALVLLAASAQAENVYGRGDPSAYIALSGMATYDDIDDLAFWDYGSSDSNINGGGTVRMGFRLGGPFAFELQGDFNNAKAWRDDDNWVITTNFRAYPMQYFGEEGDLDIFQPYVVGGIGLIGGDPKGDKYQLNGAFRTGLGLDFYLTEQLALTVGYEWVTGTGFWSERDTRNAVIGFQYIFESDAD